jgi:uncharacterized protein YndB with AHSA1/START domain
MAGGKKFTSDWKTGSAYAMVHDEIGLVVSDPAQVILDSEPYRRLAFTWHTFTPEWAAGVGMDDATVTAWRAEPRSAVAFDIEPDDQGVAKLTVVHGDFEPGSRVLQGISAGWPAVLASLKTMLETGSPLPWWAADNRPGMRWSACTCTRATRPITARPGAAIRLACGAPTTATPDRPADQAASAAGRPRQCA